jgi:hypothetical protein
MAANFHALDAQQEVRFSKDENIKRREHGINVIHVKIVAQLQRLGRKQYVLKEKSKRVTEALARERPPALALRTSWPTTPSALA